MRRQESGVRNQESGFSNREQRWRCPVPDAEYSVLSTQYLLSGTHGVAFLTVIFFLGSLVLSSRLAAADTYAARLETLAAKCDELGLTEQAKITRNWFLVRHPGRQYLFLPTSSDPAAPKTGASETIQQWQRRFSELRREQANTLFNAAKDASAGGQSARAYQLLYEVLREDLNHAEARRVLGYAKSGSQWRLPGAEKSAPRTLPFEHPQYGWRARTHWSLETAHYTLSSNHSQRELVEAGEQLENLYALWQQVFFRYWCDPAALTARFHGSNESLAQPRPKMQVVIFKTREEYSARVAAAHPKAATTLGLYDDTQRVGYFFGGDKSIYPTWYHEATHQLFQEVVPSVVDEPASAANYWALEGVALYMESLADRGGYWTVGGCEADRLQYARYRMMTGDLDMPFAKLAGMSRESIQSSDDIGRLYTAAAGLTHFFMNGHSGAYCDPFIDYVSALYRGGGSLEMLTKSTGEPPAALDQEYREFLNVTNNDLAGIPDPTRCVNLSLCRTAVTDAGLARFAGTKNFRWLDLSGSKASDAGLKFFAANSGLKQLFLEGTRVSEASLPLIASFKHLEELDLTGLPIADAGLAHLRGLKQLQQLHVTGTQVTPEGIKKLKTALPKLNSDL